MITEKNSNAGTLLKQAIKSNNRTDINVLPKTNQEYQKYKGDLLQEIDNYLECGSEGYSENMYSMWALHHLLYQPGAKYPDAPDMGWYIELIMKFLFLPENSSRFFESIGKGATPENVYETLDRLVGFFKKFNDEDHTREEIEITKFELLHDHGQFKAKDLQYIRFLVKRNYSVALAEQAYGEDLERKDDE